MIILAILGEILSRKRGQIYFCTFSRYPKGKPLFPSFVTELYKDNLKIKDVLYCQEIFLVFCIKRRSHASH